MNKKFSRGGRGTAQTKKNHPCVEYGYFPEQHKVN